MTAHVADLVADGLVHRDPDPVDRRAPRISITVAGRRALDRWRPRHVALARSVPTDRFADAGARSACVDPLERVGSAPGDDVVLRPATAGG